MYDFQFLEALKNFREKCVQHKQHKKLKKSRAQPAF